MATAEAKTGVGDMLPEPAGTPGFQRRSFGSSSASGSSSFPSPETEEFESLEKKFHEELAEKLHERKISDCDPQQRKLSEISLLERKVSGLSGKLSMEMAEEQQLSLQLVEKRQLRSFSRADEYLYAMKEDLAEWLNMLYPDISIDAENFMDTLQTGEHLLKVGLTLQTARNPNLPESEEEGNSSTGRFCPFSTCGDRGARWPFL